MFNFLKDLLFLVGTLLCLIVPGYLIVWKLKRDIFTPSDPHKAAERWLPRSLRSAAIVAVEQNLSHHFSAPSIGQVCLTGRPDAVYQTQSGHHIPVEYKTRARAKVHQSDIDQLSLQAWLLRQNGQPTAGQGLVVFDTQGGWKRRSRLVNLANDEHCLRLIRRYLCLIGDSAKPTKANDSRCKSCAHYKLCFTGFQRLFK